MSFIYKLPKTTKKEIKLLPENEYKSLVHYLLIGTTPEKSWCITCIDVWFTHWGIMCFEMAGYWFKNGVLHITKTLQRIKNTDMKTDRKTKIVIDTLRVLNHCVLFHFNNS